MVHNKSLVWLSIDIRKFQFKKNFKPILGIKNSHIAEVHFLKSNKQPPSPNPKQQWDSHNVCLLIPPKASLPPAGIPAQKPACECGWLIALFYYDNWRPPVSSRRVCLKVHFG